MSDRLILMTRFPRMGRSKTRFIPVLGVQGAFRLHRKLTEHAVSAARTWRDGAPDRRIQVSCNRGTPNEYRDWLGPDLDYDAENGGSPGARMAVASVRAFSRGADRVVLVGTDCPELDATQIERAFFGLEHADCVIGPTDRGSYYLIGLVTPTPAIFARIPWGTAAVLTQTMAAARNEGLRIGVLPRLSVLRGPGDLIHASPRVARSLEVAPTGAPTTAPPDLA
jgi:rSAM/selenodomain-associated transferase 1